jgi:HEAT repeat protein
VLLYLNDSAALTRLINRLDVEKNLQVKAKLAQALGKLAEIEAAPALIKLLDDPQPEIVIAAAKALAGDLGKKLRAEKDPTLADNAATKLENIFNRNENLPGTEDLRAACLTALAVLAAPRDKQALEIFKGHVVPAQPAEIRRAALLGLGNLGDEKTDETVADQLRDNNDATVRLCAAQALKTVATPAQLDTVVHYMEVDPDKSVQDALWIALSQKLYPKLKPQDLGRIAADLNDDPNHTKDPDKTRRLYTLQKLGESLAAANDAQGVAENQQVIADAMMAVNPPRTQDAIDSLKQALDYWKAKGDRDKLEAIIDALLDAELKAKQWDIAVKFAADQIKFDPVYQQTVGPKIKSKIDELINGDHPDLDSAKTLIDNALKMDPKLDPKYINQIQQLQDQLKAKAAAPPG